MWNTPDWNNKHVLRTISLVKYADLRYGDQSIFLHRNMRHRWKQSVRLALIIKRFNAQNVRVAQLSQRISIQPWRANLHPIQVSSPRCYFQQSSQLGFQASYHGPSSQGPQPIRSRCLRKQQSLVAASSKLTSNSPAHRGRRQRENSRLL